MLAQTAPFVLALSTIVIPWMYMLNGVGATEAQAATDSGPGDEFLLVADGSRGEIYRMQLDGSSYKTLSVQSPEPRELDYNPLDQKIYWSDSATQTIRRKSVNGTGPEDIIVKLSQASAIGGVAIDPSANFVFYSDAVRGIITLYSLNTNFSKTVVLNVNRPKSLRTDPVYRQLYWSDWGNRLIERVSYDGSGRQTVYKAPEDSEINGIALDVLARVVYWCDGTDASVKMVTMETNAEQIRDGRSPNATTVFKYNNQLGNKTASRFYGISVDPDYIYVTDLAESHILRIRKLDKSIERLGSLRVDMPDGILAYSKDNYNSGQNTDCNLENGDCSHLCIPLSDGIVCACPDDRVLQNDNRTCETTAQTRGPDLIWLEYDLPRFTGYVRGIRGEPAQYLKTREVRTWSIRSPAWYWRAADVDYHKNELYLVDRFDKFIVRMTLSGEKDIRIIYYGTSSEVNGLAYDWVAGNVYWTDALYNWIMVAKAEEKTNMTRRLLRTGFDKPHDIAVYPQEGLMFWTDWGVTDKIEVSTLAGEDRRVLVSKDLQEPKGITIDYKTNRVFWTNRQTIESVNIDGSDRKIHFRGNDYIDVALHQNFIFALDKVTDNSGIKHQLWFYEDGQTTGIRLGLPRPAHSIVMSHAKRQPQITSACTSMRCSQLCVSASNNTAQCLCKDGSKLAPDKRTCIENPNYLRPSYIYSAGDRICSVATKDATTRLLKNPSTCFFSNPPKFEFHALDFNYQEGRIYFSDTKFLVKTLRRANMTDKSDNEVIVYGTGDVEGIALDWMRGNVYWTDSTYRQVWVARLDGSYQTTLLKLVNIPYDIVVDPLDRYMYWIERTENDTSSVIRRSALDGSGVRDFVQSGLEKPTGLALDMGERRLYWADTKAQRIESINLDGTIRLRQIFTNRNKYNPYGVAVLQDFVVFTDRQPATNSSGLRIVEKTTGNEVNDGILHTGIPKSFGVVAFDVHNQPPIAENVADSCKTDNGGCEQICISTRDSFKCKCIDGMRLGTDGRSCKPAFLLDDDFFLVADDYRHQVYQLSGDLTRFTAIKFPPLDRPIGLTYDPSERKIYWTDFHMGIIKRAHIDGSQPQTLRSYRTGAKSRIDALAFEPESRLLYYSDMEQNQIGVLNPDGTLVKILVSGNMTQARAVSLLPDKGLMFFGSKGKIERAHMDGSDRQVIVTKVGDTALGWPAGITVDKNAELVYWCDHNAEKMYSADFHGSKKRILFELDPKADPFAVALRAGRLHWTDWKLRGLWVGSTGGNDVTLVHNDMFTGLNDIYYYNRHEASGPNACSHENGGCSHFCLPVPDGRVCACPDDENGAVEPQDEHNCPGLATCPRGQIPNGRLDKNCHRRLNVVCSWVCNEGFGVNLQRPLTCVQGSVWDHDLTDLCSDQTCPFLITPDSAVLDPLCPFVAAVGVKCNHSCADGYQATDGDSIRVCQPNREWSGKPLVCQVVASVSVPKSASRASALLDKWPIIAGVVVGVLLLLLAVVLLLCFLWRRKGKLDKSRARYRESSNLPPPSSPVMSEPELIVNDHTPTYDVANDVVQLNGRDLAFDNPGYATQEEMMSVGVISVTPESTQAATLPAKHDLLAQGELWGKGGHGPPKTNRGNRFENPMFPNGQMRREESTYETLPEVKK